MIDSDMEPDLEGIPGSKNFVDSSFKFIQEYKEPCLIAAPYCGPPPHENIYVFQWATLQSELPDDHFRLEQFPREQASIQTGIQEVAALPTGLIFIDMRVVKELPKPWFYYEYQDDYETHKASTEDVVFTRNVSLAGFKVFCNWNAWAGHVKQKVVGKPYYISVEDVRLKYVAAKDRLPADMVEANLIRDRFPKNVVVQKTDGELLPEK